MDGNGRWAARRGLPRIEGHRRGLEALRKTVQAAIELSLEYLTVYSFSTENWSRPFDEIQDLMRLLKRFIRRDLIELHDAGVRVKVIGDRTNLQSDIRSLLEEAETLTKLNTGLTLVVAFNYGGRQEIASAVRAIARDVATGVLREDDIRRRATVAAPRYGRYP
jgi:Undecaprenyl pyrophosphate synthetase (EC 2.5.1.31)